MDRAAKYEIECYTVSIHDDDLDTHFTVRRYGKVFYIEIFPSDFVNSPETMKKYLVYRTLLQSGEEVIDDVDGTEVYDTDVYDWVMSPFSQLLIDLAPPPEGNPEEIRVTLQESQFPEILHFQLHVEDEQLRPRRILGERRPIYPSFCRLDNSVLDDLEKWTVIFDPRNILLRFDKPEDALFKPPRKVVIENETIECFYKPCHSGNDAIRELQTYRAIAEAGLYNRGLNLCHVHGIAMDEDGFILGILLSHIDCLPGLALGFMVHAADPDDPPQGLRRVWMRQIDDAVAALHAAGIVWGDVKPHNVLVDTENNAWVTDFGCGYTEGWVDKELAETVEGDRMGLAKIRKLLLPQED